MHQIIKVAARTSLLSKAQVSEVERLLQQSHKVVFQPIFVESLGDIDLKTPLTEMAKTDFFTQNIDQLIIEGKAHIAIHSAKDLPEKLPLGLEILAITKGVDPRDSLVSYNYTLKTLPYGAKVGACSQRRIDAVKLMRPDLEFAPIRGPIDVRLNQLKNGDYDAIILAEAGLLRLQLDVPRQILDIPVAPFQGRLAIVASALSKDLKLLFEGIDAR